MSMRTHHNTLSKLRSLATAANGTPSNVGLFLLISCFDSPSRRRAFPYMWGQHALRWLLHGTIWWHIFTRSKQECNSAMSSGMVGQEDFIGNQAAPNRDTNTVCSTALCLDLENSGVVISSVGRTPLEKWITCMVCKVQMHPYTLLSWLAIQQNWIAQVQPPRTGLGHFVTD